MQENMGRMPPPPKQRKRKKRRKKHVERDVWQDRKHYLWWPISFTIYNATTERLLIQRGIVSTEYDEVFLFRVVDCRVSRTLLQKIFGTGTVELIGSDRSEGHLFIENIKNPLETKELLSRLIIKARRRHGVVEYSGSSTVL